MQRKTLRGKKMIGKLELYDNGDGTISVRLVSDVVEVPEKDRLFGGDLAHVYKGETFNLSVKCCG